jgi:hypothetical protein
MLFALLSLALAQSDEPAEPASDETLGDYPSAPPVQYRKDEHIIFDGPLAVEGELVKPQGVPVFETRRMRFNPLIELREDFNDELAHSVAEVR